MSRGKAEEERVTEIVTLRGWDTSREGLHTIHGKRIITSFKNGTAEVMPEVAEELRKAGYIE
jgi:hypothetical protein